MKSHLMLVVSVILFSIAFSLPAIAQSLPALMPIPKNIELHEGKFLLKADFTVELTGSFDERLYSGATRFLRRLSGKTGLFFPQHFLTKAQPGKAGAMVINSRGAGNLALGVDESYQLEISSEKIVLTAQNDIGILRGIETLLQLLSADETGYFFPALTIEDSPRFPWRGLLIDISRHFMSMDVLKRNLDGMAAVKMNVLHWHLVDDQGFRVESKTFPLLHEKGSDGFYYTQLQIREVIDYAAERGIRVVPEFDVPAHATSWLVGYPELGSAPGPYQIERKWGIHDPTLDPTNEKVYEFLETFFGEMCALFPDAYFHIGGDENNGKHWDANEAIQSFMNKNDIADNHALQTHFNQRIIKILEANNKKMIGWDEILQPSLPKTAIIHSWRGIESLINAAKEGYRGILSNGYYIDLVQPASFHYLNDPVPAGTKLSEKELENILGGEATMWAEMVSPETIDSRIWPRTAAIAERLWSPSTVRNIDDMYRRMARISFLLEEHGLLHHKNYEMMLRRLTNNQDITALKTLVDVVEPLEKYARHSRGVKYTATSPLTRVVDAARPESMVAREFATLVDSLIANPNDQNQYRVSEQLKFWKRNHLELEKVIAQSPVLREIESLSRDLSDVCEVGLLAGKYFISGTQPSDMWVERNLELLTAAKKSRGQVELVIIDPIIKLVNQIKKADTKSK